MGVAPVPAAGLFLSTTSLAANLIHGGPARGQFQPNVGADSSMK